MSSSPASPFFRASSLARHVQSHYLAVAALTFFSYDILLTLDDEIKYLHKGTLTLTEALYLINRYYSLSVMVTNTLVLFLPAPSNEFCLVASRWGILGSVLVKVPLDIWLLLRVYAMWNRNKKVFTFLSAFLVGIVVASLLYSQRSFGRFVFLFIPFSQRLPADSGCAVLHAGGPFWVIFALSLVYEVTIVLFTVSWAIVQFRNGLARRHAPLAHSLYQTGVFYFLIMGTVMGFMSITGFTPLNSVILPAQFLGASVSTIGSRMMLSIHKVQLSDSEEDDVLPTNFVPTDMDIVGRSTYG